LAATFTVTNTNNSGTGSLRNAISSANTNKGSTVAFSTSGTIVLSSPLPSILRTTTIDGTTAPGFSGTPTVLVNFNGNSGFVVDQTAPGSAIKSLSLVNSGGAGITLMASKVTVAGNYIGVQPNGAVNGNRGDGIYILPPSNENLIGDSNPAADIKYFDTSNPVDFTVQPVSAWQGIRNSGTTSGEYLICGSSGTAGLLYVGPIDGGGASYLVQYPGATTIATSVYGPDNLPAGGVRLVGIYRKSNTMAYNYGFVWEGTVGQLPSGGTFRTIDYPGATYQYTHSAMGELAELVLMNHPALTKNIDKLVSRGLVLRNTSPDDSRKVLVFISNTGLAMVQRLTAQVDAHHQSIHKVLGARKTEQLKKLLDDFVRDSATQH
jgi:DNA-binding MarR family transcriptional regulator